MTEPFENAKRLFLQGIAAFEAGDFGDAQTRFQESLRHMPDRVSTLTNLAATQIRLLRPEDALVTLERALAIQPDDADAWWHRGVALAELGQQTQALAAFDRLVDLRPEQGEAWMRRGQLLQQLDQPAQALSSYDRALAIDPGRTLGWTNRGNILKDLHRLDDAAASFRQALAHGGDPELNGYFLASVGGQVAPAVAPARYVQQLFDDYAESFDVHLVQVLHYRAPTVLVEHLRPHCTAPLKQALDLGCGTGLCAPLLRPLTQRLHGVDMSAGMLAKARALQLYDRLEEADAATWLLATEQRYDLVLAADVFIYVGDLAPMFRGVARVLEADGMFCFSAELPEGEADFALKPSQRYGQSEAYLRRLAATHGFRVLDVVREVLREEQQQAIPGVYVYLRRQ